MTPTEFNGDLGILEGIANIFVVLPTAMSLRTSTSLAVNSAWVIRSARRDPMVDEM